MWLQRLFAAFAIIQTSIFLTDADVRGKKEDATSFEFKYKVLERILKLEHEYRELKDAEMERSAKEKALDLERGRWKKGQPSSTYTRWGKKGCPGNGTSLVYTGYTAGSYYSHKGGGANTLCLVTDPQWGRFTDGFQNDGAHLYGGEYEFGTRIIPKKVYNHEAPCAVCRTNRATTIMMPGRRECYAGWKKEYTGYLVAGHYGQAQTSEFICLDENPDSVIGSHANHNGLLFYTTEGACGALQCPPYVQGREITCVVCSK